MEEAERLAQEHRRQTTFLGIFKHSVATFEVDLSERRRLAEALRRRLEADYPKASGKKPSER